MHGIAKLNRLSRKTCWLAYCKLSMLICVCVLLSGITNGQTFDAIKLIPATHFLENNTVSFDLPVAKLNQLHKTKGEKLSFQVPYVVVNNDTVLASRVRIRGNTSSYLRRKSLNIKLDKKAFFYKSTDTFSLKKFYAISLSMDKNYIRNKLSSEILQMLQVQYPFNCYSNLVINGKTEGVYLICYPPEEFAIKEKAAALVIRRGYSASVDKFYYEDISKKVANELRQKFLNVYKHDLNRLKGEELYNHLNSVIDMDAYFSWLAFNHLFQNGDYSDEVYFMWNKRLGKFEIIPWDFDDILRTEPHEGLAKRNALLQDKLIFSSEDPLDVTIANDPYLYQKYLIKYREMLVKISPNVLGATLNHVFHQIYQYFEMQDVIAQSQYDLYGASDLKKLEADIQAIHQTIGLRMLSLHKQINDLLDE